MEYGSFFLFVPLFLPCGPPLDAVKPMVGAFGDSVETIS